ncbi:MAG: hypothetical protein AB1607_06180 [Chloroflexota bacterium]
MKIGNQAFENSLRCLQHPVTLLSITLLLLNDHVLKVISPSWLTGKLSDFAGLFFFPFIVAAGLSVLLSRFDLKPRIIGQVSFAFVAIWLIFLKTSPYINSLTSQFASFVVGFPAQFILDWTDIVGLIAMLPAWKIWDQSHRTKPRKFAFAVLLLAISSSIASSPKEWTTTYITKIEFKDGILYAADTKWGLFSYPVARSLDGGLLWEIDPNLSKIDGNRSSHQICGVIYSQVCYRKQGSRVIQESLDGGTTWNNSLEVDDRIYDFTVFEWDGTEYVVIAIGEDGILRRSLPDGSWETIKVHPPGLL